MEAVRWVIGGTKSTSWNFAGSRLLGKRSVRPCLLEGKGFLYGRGEGVGKSGKSGLAGSGLADSQTRRQDFRISDVAEEALFVVAIGQDGQTDVFDGCRSLGFVLDGVKQESRLDGGGR